MKTNNNVNFGRTLENYVPLSERENVGKLPKLPEMFSGGIAQNELTRCVLRAGTIIRVCENDDKTTYFELKGGGGKFHRIEKERGASLVAEFGFSIRNFIIRFDETFFDDEVRI